MLNFIIYYGVFAVATGVVGYFSLINPALKDLRKILKQNEINENLISELKHPFISFLSIVIVFTLLAPFVVIPSLIGTTDETKSKYIEKVLTRTKKELSGC